MRPQFFATGQDYSQRQPSEQNQKWKCKVFKTQSNRRGSLVVDDFSFGYVLVDLENNARLHHLLQEMVEYM